MAGYGDDSGFAAWLTATGRSLPGGSPAPAILRQVGSDYLDGYYAARMMGGPAGGFDQERAWPRAGASTIYGSPVPSDGIPAAWVTASYEAAFYEALNPGGLSVSVTPASVIQSEKTGPLETVYAKGSGNAALDATPALSVIEGLVTPFLIPLKAVPLLFRTVGDC